MTRYFQPHIARLSAYTPGEQINAPGVIKLNTNENPYPPSPAVVKALAGLDADRLRKYPQPLADDFRNVAADVLGVQPEMILAGNGSDDLLRMIATAFVGPGQSAVACYPTYSLYEVLVQIENATMRWIDWPADYSLPVDELAAARAPLVFLANPNAPTGTLVPQSEVAKLARRLDDVGVLVVDEAYIDFADARACGPAAKQEDDADARACGPAAKQEDDAGAATVPLPRPQGAGASVSCLPLVRQHDNVIVLRTFSKGYSLAGLRFGYAVASPDLISGLTKVKDSYNCDAVSIALAAAAIADQAYLRSTAGRVVAERGRLTAELTRRGWDVLPSRANFVLARPPDGLARRRYEALKQRNILVRYFDSRRIDDRLRITIGTPGENDALLSALDEL